MGDAIVPITSRLLGRRTGETDPREGKPLDDRRTGPAYPATVGAGRGGGSRKGRHGITTPPSARPHRPGVGSRPGPQPEVDPSPRTTE